MVIIFDCDGVLRSVSWVGLYEAYIAVATRLGIDPEMFWQNVDDFKHWYDSDWHVNMEKLGVPKGKEPPGISNFFHEVYDPHVKIFPWVKSVLNELASRHNLAVLSSSLSSSVSNTLGEITGYFSLVVGCDNVCEIKPSPEGINLILKKFQADPLDGMMIGDTSVDILAGRNAGVMTAVVTWGMETEKDWKIKPDIVIDNPDHFFSL